MKITLSTRLMVAISALVAFSGCSLESNNTSRQANVDASSPIPTAIGTRNPAIADSYELVFAAPKGTTSLIYCIDAELAACTGGTAAQVSARALSVATRPEISFFKTSDYIAMRGGQAFSLVAKDQTGNLLASTRIRISDKNAPTGPNLSAAQNLSLTGVGGVSKKLADVFEGQYLLLDLSGAECGGCIQLAHYMESDSALQSILNTKKCSLVTLVDSLDGWLYQFPDPKSTTRSHSFSVPGGPSNAIRAFGISLAVTPTVLLIDRTGKVVGNAQRMIPPEFKDLCK